MDPKEKMALVVVVIFGLVVIGGFLVVPILDQITQPSAKTDRQTPGKRPPELRARTIMQGSMHEPEPAPPPPAAAPQVEDTYVRVTARTEIRTTAGGGELVGEALPGDVFEFGKEAGDWTGVTMFSAHYRYLRSANVTKTELPSLPALAVQQRVYRAMGQIEDQAIDDAMARYPTDLDDQLRYERLLNDQRKLKLFQREGVAPALASKITWEGAKARW